MDHAGFIWQEASVALLTDHQIFGRILPRPRRRRAKRRVQGVRAEMLQIGDFVVHVDYGIGRYVGLDKIGSGSGEPNVWLCDSTAATGFSCRSTRCT